MPTSAGGSTRCSGCGACSHHAIWDEPAQELVCVRDRFGIKPFHYSVVGDILYFASEVKALLPMLPSIETDLDGLKDYLAFQFCLAGKTLFKGVWELQPGHLLQVRRGGAPPQRYWEVFYEVDFDHTGRYFEEQVEHLLAESVRLHLRSDVPVSAYLSGGVDSSAVASIASAGAAGPRRRSPASSPRTPATTSRDSAPRRGSERGFDLQRGRHRGFRTSSPTSSASPTRWTIQRPAPDRSRSTWSRRRPPREVKVILGGQGGDEIFGGYARYLIAYFEQCIKERYRRHASRGQLRCDLRVDHSQPCRAAELQADVAGLLARGAVRRSRRPLLPTDRPLAPRCGRVDSRRPRRILALRDIPGDLQRRQRRPRSPTSTR